MEFWNIGFRIHESIIPIFHCSSLLKIALLEYWNIGPQGMIPGFHIHYSNVPVFQSLWLPAATECAVKLDNGVELIAPGAREQQLLIEELLVCDQNFEVVRQPSIVTQSRQTGSFL